MKRRRENQRGFTIIELLVALTVGSVLLTVVMGVFMTSLNYGETLFARTRMANQARIIFDAAAMGGVNTCVNSVDITGCDAVPHAPPETGNPSPPETDDIDGEDIDYLFGFRGRNATAGASDTDGRSAFATAGNAPLMAWDGATPLERLYRFALPPAGNVREGASADTAPTLSILSDEGVVTTLTCEAIDNPGADEIGFPVQGCTAVGATVNIHGYLRADPEIGQDGGNFRTRSVAVQLIDPYAAARGENQAEFTDDSFIDRYWTMFTMNVESVP